MFDFLIPYLGAGVAGALALAMKAGIKYLFVRQRSKRDESETTQRRLNDADREEGRMLIERNAALWDEQKEFVDDLHGAVKRLSESNAKKDRIIDKLTRDVAHEREQSFELSLQLRAARREVEDLKEERSHLRARLPSTGPLPTFGDD